MDLGDGDGDGADVYDNEDASHTPRSVGDDGFDYPFSGGLGAAVSALS